ncbi:Phytocyanin domain [Dillenia turbinata]|uniref:Phytocyanin domain n=1 Tax=Dillenia turbinata TaxID=194707 RepID=A0AAN8W6D7_9MAGN
MTWKLLVVIPAIVTILLPSAIRATDYTVGDDKGWTVSVNYQAWAKDKQFRVGDKLVFRYQPGDHNVFRVNGTSFKTCTVPPDSEALTSGNDIVTLDIPGRKWYICGVPEHCASLHQKLAIRVYPAARKHWSASAPAPAPPTPTNHAIELLVPLYRIFISAIAAFLVIAKS